MSSQPRTYVSILMQKMGDNRVNTDFGGYVAEEI